MIRVYVDMAADLFHSGHLSFLKKARGFGDFLVAGIHSDETILSYKREPIICEKDRYEMVRQCCLVDEIIEDAPTCITKDYIREHRIDIVIHGDDITKELKIQHQEISEMGIVRYVPYTPGISTTKIINKIKNMEE